MLARAGKIYAPKPLAIKTRKELLATIKPHQWQYLRADNGDLPADPPPRQRIFAARAMH